MCQCPMCNSDQAMLVGTLGTRDHFRCRLCGWVWSEDATPTDDDEPENAE